MVSPFKAIILLPLVLFSTTTGAVPSHTCRTVESSPLLSDCQIALSLWQDDVAEPEICVRDNRAPLAEHNRCLIIGYNIDLKPINPNVPVRNEYCFTKDLVRQTLRYLTWQCGLPLAAENSPHGHPDIRIEGEYKFDSIDGLDTQRYRSVRVIDADYDHLELWADGSIVSPNEWEQRRYNWEHRARTFTGKEATTEPPKPAVTVGPRVRPSVVAALATAVPATPAVEDAMPAREAPDTASNDAATALAIASPAVPAAVPAALGETASTLTV